VDGAAIGVSTFCGEQVVGSTEDCIADESTEALKDSVCGSIAFPSLWGCQLRRANVREIMSGHRPKFFCESKSIRTFVLAQVPTNPSEPATEFDAFSSVSASPGAVFVAFLSICSDSDGFVPTEQVELASEAFIVVGGGESRIVKFRSGTSFSESKRVVEMKLCRT
jgi:hypothetical protein